MLPIESLSGITTFVVAARAHSFTDAAAQLGVSKSAVGKSIARLEERLGVKLFLRTTRRVTLSADGQAYFAACSAALEEIGAAENSLGGRAMSPSGRLRIDMPVVFGRKVMMPILLEIGCRYPDLHFTMTFADHLIDPIEEGVDLAIRFGEPKDSTELIARRLTSQRWVICGAPKYLEKHGTPVTLDDLAFHQGIVGYRRDQPLSWRVSIEGEAQRFSPPATHQLSDGDAIVDATLAGLGLCQIPESLVREHIAEGRLVTVLDEYTQDLVDVHAVWPRAAHLRPKVKCVVETLVELGQLGRLG
ncbi:LysR family transcriptional regulator [Pseudomonas nitroreducens]|uniref:LysR family transcriptional regulator n=1 Tax=Pseudomonas nitroreducens TaxID=46680 RepID=UPI0020A12AE2|nr:LysR family transcriptional regulator [Pseudomonas nitroreducens]MCP1623639.1 DNA-binding transcriptional LysR family regulator [Pseudomonas nitroreducens]